MAGYWYVNNAINKVAAGTSRSIGGGRLTLNDASSFGDPTPTTPLRGSVFRDGSPLGILRIIGREANDLLIDGPADDYADFECLAGDLVANVPAAGDFIDLINTVAAIYAQPTTTHVVDTDDKPWVATVPAYCETVNPTTIRVVDVSHGMPVSHVGSIFTADDVYVTADGQKLPATSVAIDAATTGDAIVVAGVSGKKIRVLRWSVIAGGDVVLRWKSGATNLTGAMSLAANSRAGDDYCKLGVFTTGQGEALSLNLSADVQVGGSLAYVLI